MKKLFYLILLTLVLIPSQVKADMGAPFFNEYDAITTKDTSIYNYDYDYNEPRLTKEKDIPKGTKVKIRGEYSYNNETYGIADDGYINLKDLMFADAKVNSKDAYKLENPGKIYILTDDVYIYDGPSKLYKKSEKPIKKGTILTYEYANDKSNYSWIYVNYNGAFGWINIPDTENIADVLEDTTAMTLKNISTLYEKPDEKSSKITTNIPKNTEVIVKYSSGRGGSFYYITYNGTSGWLKNDEKIVLNEEGTILVMSEFGIKAYKEYDNTNSENINIPKNSTFKFKYRSYTYDQNSSNSEWYYISYNNSYYWIKKVVDENSLAIKLNYKSDKYMTKISTNMYPDLDSDETINIPKNTEVTVKYEFYYNEKNWYYVEYNNKTGWIDNDNLAIKAEEKYLAFKDLNIYEEPGNENSKKSTLIPKNTEIASSYYDTYYGFVYLPNYQGWLDTKYLASRVEDSYKTLKNIKIYESPSLTSKEIKELPGNTKINTIYEYIEYSGAGNGVGGITTWLYISNNDYKGWIIKEQNVELNKELTPEIKKESPKKENKISPKEIIIFTSLGVACLVITALVTIILINKNKKNQNA